MGVFEGNHKRNLNIHPCQECSYYMELGWLMTFLARATVGQNGGVQYDVSR